MKLALKFQLVFILILSIEGLFAQVTPLTTNVTNEISVVRTFPNGLIVAANSGNILRSDNFGSTFDIYPIVDLQNNEIPLAAIYDFHFFSSNVFVAVGTSAFGQNAVILKTTNGGLNWAISYQNSTGTWPNIINNVHFISNLIGIGVGTNGRILRTVNGGISWNVVNSGTTNELRDVVFNSLNEGVIVGDGIKMKSSNSGVNWSVTSTNSNYCNSAALLNSSVGYAIGDDHILSKTTNGGTIWNDSNLNFQGSVAIPELAFISDTEGFFIGNNGLFYHTTTSGQYWSTLNLGFEPASLTVAPWNQIYVSGYTGEIVQINPNSYFQPIANFTLNSNVLCYNQLTNFTNLSDPNLSSTWLLDGTPISQDYNLSYLANTPNQSHEVTLVVSDGVSSDSLTKTIYVNEGNEFNLNVNVSAPQICSNGSTTISVLNSSQAISYQLYKNSLPVGSPVSGNNSTLNFQTGALQVTTEYCITATLNLSSCAPMVHSWCGMITIQNPIASIVTLFEQDTICPNSLANLIVFNSQNAVTYSLYVGNVQQGASQLGNSQNLNFNIPSINQNTTAYIKGVSALGCVTNYPAQPLVVQNPGVYWTSVNFSPLINEPIVLINTTQTEGTYLWDLGSGASISQSNLFEPLVSYSTSGVHDVTLTHTTPLGCIESVTRKFHVVDSFLPEQCEKIRILDVSAPAIASTAEEITRDHSENIISVARLSGNPISYTTSNNGDYLALERPLNGTSLYKLFIVKYLPDGRPMWSACIQSEDRIGHSSITTDSNDNIIFLFEANSYQDTVKIFTADQKMIKWKPNSNYVTIKFDSNGIFQWKSQVNYLYSPPLRKVFVKTDEDNSIYACTATSSHKYNSSGELIYNIQSPFADVIPDNSGGFFGLVKDFPRIYHYSAVGALIEQSPNIYQTNGATSSIPQLQLRSDEHGNLYALGGFKNNMVFGIDTLSSIYTNGLSLLKFNSELMPVSSKTMTASTQIFLKGFDVRENNVVIASLNSGATIDLNGGLMNNFDNNFHYFLYRSDTLLNNAQVKSMFQIDPTSTVTTQLDNLALTEDGNRLSFQFYYDNTINFQNGNQFIDDIPGYKYIGITNFDLACLCDAYVPSEVIAYFDSPIKSCQNLPIELQNFSQNAISNYWTFEGANLLNSQEENPQVIFQSPGIHQVSLTCTSANGAVNTYTSYVQVSAPVYANYSMPEHICQGDDFVIEFNHNATNVVPPLEYNVAAGFLNIQNDTILTYTFSNEACFLEKNIIIDINIPQVLTFFGDLPDTICTGMLPIPLPFPSVAGGSFSAEHSEILNGYLYPPPSGLDRITYTFYNTNTNCLYYHLDSIFVVQNDIYNTFSPTSSAYCGSDTLTLEINPTGWVEQSTWNFQSGTVLSQGFDTCVIALPESGSFTYNVTLSNPYCTYESEFVSFIIKPLPTVTMSPFLEDTICSNSTAINLVPGQPVGGYYLDEQNALVPGTNVSINPALLIPNVTDTISYIYEAPNGCSNIATNTITAVVCQDIENHSSDKPFVFISQNNSTINIQNLIGTSEIQIFDASGRLILSDQCNTDSKVYEIGSYANSMYFVKIISNKRTNLFKINANK
jgi:photosystem II stability/assembly factor-like uncharacterized protein/PKD repeat protein